MKRLLILALAGSAAVPAVAQNISIAAGDWADVPLIHHSGTASFNSGAIERMRVEAASANCSLAGQRGDSIDLSVPFLVEFTPAGAVQSVVVQRMNCAPAEKAIGAMVLQMAKAGHYRPTGENQTGWYRGNFELEIR